MSKNGKDMFAVHLPQIGQMQEGTCATCGQHTDFVFIGTQQYPSRVAEKLKVALIVQQWRCTQCHTTLSVSNAEQVA